MCAVLRGKKQQMANHELLSVLSDALSKEEDAYKLLRRPAKEVMLTVVSDLDRNPESSGMLGHAVPIQYGLLGFSLDMHTVRRFIFASTEACFDTDLNVKVISFDGQFTELTTKGDNGKPLTVNAFQKHFWETVMKTERKNKLNTLLDVYGLPPVHSDNASDYYIIEKDRDGIHM